MRRPSVSCRWMSPCALSASSVRVLVCTAAAALPTPVPNRKRSASAVTSAPASVCRLPCSACSVTPWPRTAAPWPSIRFPPVDSTTAAVCRSVTRRSMRTPSASSRRMSPRALSTSSVRVLICTGACAVPMPVPTRTRSASDVMRAPASVCRLPCSACSVTVVAATRDRAPSNRSPAVLPSVTSAPAPAATRWSMRRPSVSCRRMSPCALSASSVRVLVCTAAAALPIPVPNRKRSPSAVTSAPAWVCRLPCSACSVTVSARTAAFSPRVRLPSATVSTRLAAGASATACCKTVPPWISSAMSPLRVCTSSAPAWMRMGASAQSIAVPERSVSESVSTRTVPLPAVGSTRRSEASRASAARSNTASVLPCAAATATSAPTTRRPSTPLPVDVRPTRWSTPVRVKLLASPMPRPELISTDIA